MDTVGALLATGIRVQVVDAKGRAVRGVSLRSDVISGGGTIDRAPFVSDTSGQASKPWQLGGEAGTQTATVRFAQRTEGLHLRDLRAGTVGAEGGPLTVSATAVPGTPKHISLSTGFLSTDAVGAKVQITATARDAHNNLVLQPALKLHSLDTGVVRPVGDGILLSTGPGTARVQIQTGSATDTVVVAVNPRPVKLTASAASPILTRIGGVTKVTARLTDRLGATVQGPAPVLRLLKPRVIALVGEDSVVALGPGVRLIEASYRGMADTLEITVAPVVASLVLTRSADTVDLDARVRPSVQAFDSSGTPVTQPLLELTPTDTSIASASLDTLVARLPGETSVRIRSGTAEVNYPLTVEGVALLADGVRSPGAAAVSVARRLELTNGRVRLRWHPLVAERGGFEMDTRIGKQWYPATVRGAGDWLYVTATVLTEPTSITVVEDSRGQVALSMRFGNHKFDPGKGYPSNYQITPFPFSRTLWLRPREYGYFSWTHIETIMVWKGMEFEVGFGGKFGPATIRTGQMLFRTDTMTKHNRFNIASVPDAAELDLDGDPLMRVLVPLPEAPMISPVFPGWGYGSVYVHRGVYEDYGAYLYAAPRAVAAPPRQVCLSAWTQAPFPLRTLTPAEMSACGAT